MFLDEYHVDGLRFDQVTVIDEHGGGAFCQDLTSTLRHRKPSAVLICASTCCDRSRRRPFD